MTTSAAAACRTNRPGDSAGGRRGSRYTQARLATARGFPNTGLGSRVRTPARGDHGDRPARGRCRARCCRSRGEKRRRASRSFARSSLGWIVPRAVRAEELLGLARAPCVATVWQHLVMVPQHGVDRDPSCLNSILASEECAVADHRVAQQSLVGRFGAEQLLAHVELLLVANELLARTFYACSERDRGVRREVKAQIVCRSRQWHGVREQLRRRRLELYQHLGGGD